MILSNKLNGLSDTYYERRPKALIKRVLMFSGGIESDQWHEMVKQSTSRRFCFLRFLPYALADYVRKFPEENETEDKK